MSLMEPSANEETRLAVLDGLLYADGFGCALTLEELWRYSAVPVKRDALRRLLDDDPILRALVARSGDLYSLAGRAHLLDERPARLARAQRLERRGFRVARLLRHVPFVRALMLTGSVAAGDARAGADVDLLVVVAPERVGTVFAILGTAGRLTRRRWLCPNYYASIDDLTMVPRTLYVAHEVAQTRALVGDAAQLRAANDWLGEFLPNAAASAVPPPGLPAGRRLQRLLERALRGSLGDAIERRARALARARLATHHRAAGEEFPAAARERLDAGTGLRFHRGGFHQRALERHSAAQANLRAEVARLRTGPHADRFVH
jgi:predicted nucleotidyltransferase